MTVVRDERAVKKETTEKDQRCLLCVMEQDAARMITGTSICSMYELRMTKSRALHTSVECVGRQKEETIKVIPPLEDFRNCRKKAPSSQF